mmetsp:Transcript_37719/g.49677  ORF Transcript_37719/g.49677 Transcript_37719/m.49677 type:complete len:279 (-) Transcript_37719:319-1155(-)
MEKGVKFLLLITCLASLHEKLCECFQTSCISNDFKTSRTAHSPQHVINQLANIKPYNKLQNLERLHMSNQEWVSRPRITFVTGNSNKLKEVRMIVQSSMDSCLEVSNREIDLPELQGEAETISKEKCKLAAETVGGPVIVEDTSLCFNGIGGMPGPYVKWFHQSIGNDGMYRMLDGFGDKTGYAQCALSFSLGPGHEPETFLGVAHGRIVKPELDSGFGWDPIFMPNGYSVTFSQMEKVEKNKISHRSQALKMFKEYLQKNPEILEKIRQSSVLSMEK